jgi:glycosyltransferase involved in cell wall biosynthesis
VLISVIIASRNEGANLHRTVNSILESDGTLDLEFVIVDDGSTDDSVDPLRALVPNLRIVRHDKSKGVSPARVSGAAVARGGVLVFFDAHVKPEPRCIERLVDGIVATDGGAVLVPMVTQFDTATWTSNEALRGFGYSLSLDVCKGRWLELSEMKERSVGRTVYYESPTVVGCSVAVGRATYDHVMGFDPIMRTWGMEDVDFGIRAWMTGHPVLCEPSARLGHRFVEEFTFFQDRMIDMGANQIKMSRKLFNDETYGSWLAMRGISLNGTPQSDAEGVELWQQAWAQVQEDIEMVTGLELEFKRRRVMDEFEYARYFGLDWPNDAG